MKRERKKDKDRKEKEKEKEKIAVQCEAGENGMPANGVSIMTRLQQWPDQGKVRF